MKAEKQLEMVFGCNINKLREVMISDEIPDFMDALDHCTEMRHKVKDEAQAKKQNDVFNIYKPIDSVQLSGMDKK